MGGRKRVQIDIYPDYILWEGQRVARPMHWARSRWMAYWEGLQWPKTNGND